MEKLTTTEVQDAIAQGVMDYLRNYHNIASIEDAISQGVEDYLKANKLNDWVRVSIGLKEEMKHFFSAMEEILPEYDEKFGRPE